MKNKEIEELLNNIKEQLIIDEKLGKEIAQDFHKTILNYEETKLLLSYIEQLENNREKVLKIINIEKNKMGYAKYVSCLLLIEQVLKGDSDD